MSARRIALLLKDLGGGGVQRSMLQLAGGLRERGARVELWVCRPRGAFRERVPPGVELVPLRASPPGLARLRVLQAEPAAWRELLLPVLLPPVSAWQLRHLSALAQRLRQSPPDAVVTSGTYLSLAALWARDVAGARTAVVVSERGNLSHHLFHGRRRFRLRLRALPPLLRRVYPRADAIVGVSDGVVRDLASLTGIPAARMRTIYNPVVTPELLAQAQAPAPHPWLEDGGPPVVLGVGRLVPQKGFATLLEAVARLRRERRLRLLVLGEGRHRRALERQARRLGLGADFALPGFAPNPFAYMARAAVFVLPSFYEGLPGVLIQALACGCPVVSTDCPDGPREILADGAWGPLLPVGDAAALAAAIARVLDHPPERERLRRRGLDFGAEPAVRAYLEVVDAAVASRAASLTRPG